MNTNMKKLTALFLASAMTFSLSGTVTASADSIQDISEVFKQNFSDSDFFKGISNLGVDELVKPEMPAANDLFDTIVNPQKPQIPERPDIFSDDAAKVLLDDLGIDKDELYKLGSDLMGEDGALTMPELPYDDAAKLILDNLGIDKDELYKLGHDLIATDDNIKMPELSPDDAAKLILDKLDIDKDELYKLGHDLIATDDNVRMPMLPSDEALKAIFENLGIDREELYKFGSDLLNGENNLSKDELLAMCDDPLLKDAWGRILDGLKQPKPVKPDVDPSQPHEHTACVFPDIESLKAQGHFDGNRYVVTTEVDLVTRCIICGEELGREHKSETYDRPLFNKDVIFGDDCALSEETMLKLLEKVNTDFITDMHCGLADAADSEMCEAWFQIPRSYVDKLVEDGMLERFGAYFGEKMIEIIPTSEELEEEAKNWSEEDEANMQKALAPELYKKNVIAKRVVEKKTALYLQTLEDVKEDVSQKVFDKYIAELGIDKNEIFDKVTKESISDDLRSLDSFSIGAKLTRGELLELLPKPIVGAVSGQTETQRVRRQEYEARIGEDTALVLSGDLDKDGVVTSADALSVLRISVGIGEISSEDIAVVDLDEDRTITSADALAILRESTT